MEISVPGLDTSESGRYCPKAVLEFFLYFIFYFLFIGEITAYFIFGRRGSANKGLSNRDVPRQWEDLNSQPLRPDALPLSSRTAPVDVYHVAVHSK